MNAIEVNNLTKEYKGFKLDSLSFKLPKGSILGIVGENGAGKSTTIKLIMNAIKSDSGNIKVLGVDTTSNEFNKVKQKIGIVLDETCIHENLKMKEINSIMKITYNDWDSNKFYELLSKLSIPLDKTLKTFSKGMRMKLAIAISLSHNPELLILDEPTGGLDPMIRDEVLDMLNDFTRNEKKLCIFLFTYC